MFSATLEAGEAFRPVLPGVAGLGVALRDGHAMALFALRFDLGRKASQTPSSAADWEGLLSLFPVRLKDQLGLPCQTYGPRPEETFWYFTTTGAAAPWQHVTQNAISISLLCKPICPHPNAIC